MSIIGCNMLLNFFAERFLKDYKSQVFFFKVLFKLQHKLSIALDIARKNRLQIEIRPRFWNQDL